MADWYSDPRFLMGMGLLSGNTGLTKQTAFANAMGGGLLGLREHRRQQEVDSMGKWRQAQLDQWQAEQQARREAAEAALLQQRQQQAYMQKHLPQYQHEFAMGGAPAVVSRMNQQPTLKQVIGPDGKPMWATARDAIGEEAYTPPGVTVNTGPGWLPKGYIAKDPENPAAGVTPIPGGPADQKALDKLEVLNSFQYSLTEYENLLKKHGTEFLPGEAKTKLKTAYKDLQLEAKEFYQLGVLAGPDIEMIEGVLSKDPTSLSGNLSRNSSYTGALNIVKKKLEAARKRLEARRGKQTSNIPPPPPGFIIQE